MKYCDTYMLIVMGLEHATCNNCGGKIEVTRSIEGMMRVEKTTCYKCKGSGSTAWSLVQNGKRRGTLAKP